MKREVRSVKHEAVRLSQSNELVRFFGSAWVVNTASLLLSICCGSRQFLGITCQFIYLRLCHTARTICFGVLYICQWSINNFYNNEECLSRWNSLWTSKFDPLKFEPREHVSLKTILTLEISFRMSRTKPVLENSPSPPEARENTVQRSFKAARRNHGVYLQQ